jgi:hypothetical protein
MVWGFLLSLAAMFGAACFEAFKIVAVIPAAFESAPSVFRNPMAASDDDSPPMQSGRGRSTARQRAENAARAAQQGQ